MDDFWAKMTIFKSQIIFVENPTDNFLVKSDRFSILNRWATEQRDFRSKMANFETKISYSGERYSKKKGAKGAK